MGGATAAESGEKKLKLFFLNGFKRPGRVLEENICWNSKKVFLSAASLRWVRDEPSVVVLLKV